MRTWMYGSMLAAAVLIGAGGCKTTMHYKPAPPASLAHQPPATPREFRAAWVATVENIDWPTKPGLSTADQKAEVIKILDRAKEMNLNAIVLQVRTSCDAMYDSKLEPWSEYLTGLQGKAPNPYYDPLQYWVEESHKRGIELHAWCNPYRAKSLGAKHALAASHVANTHPEIVKKYGGFLWMDPSEPESAKQTLAVFMDLVKRYDIDGVHMDDYFYPYPIEEKAKKGTTTASTTASTASTAAADKAAGESISNALNSNEVAATLTVKSTTTPTTTSQPATKPVNYIPFPDAESYQRYTDAGGTLTREDWRRKQVDDLVEKLYAEVKAEKPWVKVGLAPFGLGKPDLRPPGIKGFSQYDKLYADADKWLENGWCDYWTPQLYWKIDKEGQQFPILLDYWVKQNKLNRNFWPGMYSGKADPKVDGKNTWPISEVVNQIKLTRAKGDAANGQVHFSMVSFMRDKTGLASTLKKGVYATPAVIPGSPWLSKTKPETPTLAAKFENGQTTITPVQAGVTQVATWAVWTKHSGWFGLGGKWSFQSVPGGEKTVVLKGKFDAICVSAVDRVGNESGRVIVVK